jgi:hypothetical protein
VHPLCHTSTDSLSVCHSQSRVGNFRPKNYSAEDGIDGKICLFRRNSGCSAKRKNSRNSVPKGSAEEKNVRNSVPWNKIRSKRSEFHSEPFRGRENNSEFRSVEQKYKQALGILFRPFRGRDNNSEFRSEACLGRKHAVNSVCWSRIFAKTNFFHAISFRSELRNRLFRKLRNALELALSSAE